MTDELPARDVRHIETILSNGYYRKMSFNSQTGKAPEEITRTSDPKALRALAHPVRIALLQALSVHGELTATAAGQAIGEGASNCSFHFRQLAKYGLVEESDGAHGRMRPWRLTGPPGIRIPDDSADPEVRLASAMLGGTMLDFYLDRIRGVARRPTEVTGIQLNQALLYVTSDEHQQFTADLTTLLLRYQDRLADPALRPAGVNPVEVVAFSYVHDTTSLPDVR